MDERTITRALLGDREAQEAITARGELLPCHGCGFRAEIKTLKRGIFKKRIYFYALCPYCRNSSGVSLEKRDVIKCWNQRAPLLTPAQMEVLGRMEGSK